MPETRFPRRSLRHAPAVAIPSPCRAGVMLPSRSRGAGRTLCITWRRGSLQFPSHLHRASDHIRTCAYEPKILEIRVFRRS